MDTGKMLGMGGGAAIGGTFIRSFGSIAVSCGIIGGMVIGAIIGMHIKRNPFIR